MLHPHHARVIIASGVQPQEVVGLEESAVLLARNMFFDVGYARKNSLSLKIIQLSEHIRIPGARTVPVERDSLWGINKIKKMEDIKIQDKLIFYILFKLKRFGHEKLPLEIIREKQSYIVGHRRKRWNRDEYFIDEACKITFVKSRNIWKLFWKRADLKWHLYEEYADFDKLLEEVRVDPNGCFWG